MNKVQVGDLVEIFPRCSCHVCRGNYGGIFEVTKLLSWGVRVEIPYGKRKPFFAALAHQEYKVVPRDMENI